MGNLIQSKTYGYNDFNQVISQNIIFDSFGDYFYEQLKYTTAAVTSFQLMFRKVQLYQLRQMWSTSFGTATGDLNVQRGAVLTLDNNFFIVPFDPMANSDYVPDPANNYVGLMSIAGTTGATNWVSLYTPST